MKIEVYAQSDEDKKQLIDIKPNETYTLIVHQGKLFLKDQKPLLKKVATEGLLGDNQNG